MELYLFGTVRNWGVAFDLDPPGEVTPPTNYNALAELIAAMGAECGHESSITAQSLKQRLTRAARAVQARALKEGKDKSHPDFYMATQVEIWMEWENDTKGGTVWARIGYGKKTKLLPERKKPNLR